MKPTIGRIVIYNTTETEREALPKIGINNVQKQLPAVIVAVWGDTETPAINVKVFVDGTHGDLWKTSIQNGDGEGQWNWPVIAK